MVAYATTMRAKNITSTIATNTISRHLRVARFGQIRSEIMDELRNLVVSLSCQIRVLQEKIERLEDRIEVLEGSEG